MSKSKPPTKPSTNTSTHDVYIGGVSGDNTSADVTTFLKAEGVQHINAVHPLTKKDDWQSFKVSLSVADYNRVLHNIKWPAGVKVRPFHPTTNKYRPKSIKASTSKAHQPRRLQRAPTGTVHARTDERQYSSYDHQPREYQQWRYNAEHYDDRRSYNRRDYNSYSEPQYNSYDHYE